MGQVCVYLLKTMITEDKWPSSSQKVIFIKKKILKTFSETKQRLP